MSQSSPDLRRLRQEYGRRDHNQNINDRYAKFNLAHLFALQQRQRETINLLGQLGQRPRSGMRVLELGCGQGGVLLELLGYSLTPHQLHGTDLILSRLYAAQEKLPVLSFTCADGQHLPYAKDTFDILLQFTVFSSILDQDIKINLAQEMMRVLRRRNGLILWYDFWLNPTNKQTRGIRPAEIKQLFPGCRFTFRRLTLAPPLARRLVPLSWTLCLILEKLKLFNTHYLVAIQPK